MMESDRVLPRRTVLKTAGLGVGAGLFAGVSAPAQALRPTATSGALNTGRKRATFPSIYSVSGSARQKRANRRGRFFSLCTAPR